MAVVGIAIAVIRAQSRFDQTAREISETAARMRQSIERLDTVTLEARQMLDSLSGSVSRITSIADRTTRISNAVLEEIEAPLRTAVAVARGVRTGTSRFVERIGQRFHRRIAEHNGGNAA
jgi:hypothetical protein